MSSMDAERQRELDRQILAYVRGIQDMGPVTEEAVHRYLTTSARMDVDRYQVRDRLHYLSKAGDLDELEEWDGGRVVRYEITAQGMDRMDGILPPHNWRPAR